MRKYTNIEQQVLDPEKAVNWSIGFDYTPTGFLTGLNLQATYYIVKINGILRNFGNPGTGAFNDTSRGFAFLTPEDLHDPLTGAPLCAGQNATPWLCAPFQEVVAAVLAHPEIEVPSNLQTLVYWINDGGTMNVGWQRTKGIDWQASYDWEWESLGAFNVGITGTYYLSQESQVPGGIIDDFYHTTFPALNGVEQIGVESRPRLKYRARLGWSDGTWSVTGFMDYESHFFHTQSAPPNVNAACITPGGTVGGLPNYSNPCWVTDYTNIPAELLHVRSVARLQHGRPAGQRLSEERQSSSSWCRTSWTGARPTSTGSPPAAETRAPATSSRASSGASSPSDCKRNSRSPRDLLSLIIMRGARTQLALPDFSMSRARAVDSEYPTTARPIQSPAHRRGLDSDKTIGRYRFRSRRPRRERCPSWR